MILYKLAKWMEERKDLTKSIQAVEESQGDPSFLLHKKEQIDERMIAETSRWFDPPRDGVPLYMLPDGGMPEEVQEWMN